MCSAPGITGFLDFVHCPIVKKSFGNWKQLETPTLLDPLERANLSGRVILISSY
jgi:hypothetical protein